jgi:hypothetical protein
MRRGIVNPLAGAALPALLVLAGCTYTADVRNTTSEPVFVQMLQIDPIQPDWVLATARIAPGQYAKLGPRRVPFERVVVDVGNQKQKSVNARLRIRTGMTKLDVGSRPSEDPGREETVFTLQKRNE